MKNYINILFPLSFTGFRYATAQTKTKHLLIITTYDYERGNKPKEDCQHFGEKIAGSGQIWIAPIEPGILLLKQ
ncbi:MAG TPA: hypothetical protein VIJ95_07370 [Hanamia sp.]